MFGVQRTWYEMVSVTKEQSATVLSVMLLWALKARRWRRGSTTREVDGELWRAGDHKGSLVLRWTSKLGRCLTRQSKRRCSEAVDGEDYQR